MRKQLLLLISVLLSMSLSSAFGQIPIDESHFPDYNFRKWLKTQSYGSDSQLTTYEISKVKEMNCSYQNIADLTGIEYFTYLTNLNCTGNRSLTVLDVSQLPNLLSLSCGYTAIPSLDVSHNPELIKLLCNYCTSLASVNLGEISKLEIVTISDALITTLDVTHLSSLGTLQCNGCSLTSLDLSGNPDLVTLFCYGNNLTSLDLSYCPKIATLYCYDNVDLGSLDVSAQYALAKLNCSNCGLTGQLIVSGKSPLTELDCSNNRITSLDISDNFRLSTVNCYDNAISEIIADNSPQLSHISCYRNNLQGDAVTEFIAALPERDPDLAGAGTITAYAPITDNNVITESQVQAAEAKGWNINYVAYGSGSTYIYKGVGSDDIPIDAEHFPDANFREFLLNEQIGNDALLSPYERVIPTLDCSDQGISDLTGIEYFNGLTRLICQGNNLESLNVSNSPELVVLDVSNNNFNGGNVERLIKSLPIRAERNGRLQFKAVGGDDENLITVQQVADAMSRGWKVYAYDADQYVWVPYNGDAYPFEVPTVDVNTFPDENFRNYVIDNFGYTLSDLANQWDLDVSGLEISDLTGIEYFSNLWTLNCSNNQLTGLDLTGNPTLSYLNCRDNKLTRLNVSHLPELEELVVSGNYLLEELELPNKSYSNSGTFYLYASGCSSLDELDLSPVSEALRTLVLENAISLCELDLRACTHLTRLNVNGSGLASLDLSNNHYLFHTSVYPDGMDEITWKSYDEIEEYYGHIGPTSDVIEFGVIKPTVRMMSAEKSHFGVNEYNDPRFLLFFYLGEVEGKQTLAERLGNGFTMDSIVPGTLNGGYILEPNQTITDDMPDYVKEINTSRLESKVLILDPSSYQLKFNVYTGFTPLGSGCGEWLSPRRGGATLKEEYTEEDLDRIERFGQLEVVIDWYTPNMVTSVLGLKSDTAVKSVKYFNIAGMSSDTPFEGLNIVVTTHTDGTVTTRKVFK